MEPAALRSIGLGVEAAPSLGLASSDLLVPASGVKALTEYEGVRCWLLLRDKPPLALPSDTLGLREPGAEPAIVAMAAAAVAAMAAVAVAVELPLALPREDGGAVGLTSGLGRILFARASAVVLRFLRGKGPGLE